MGIINTSAYICTSPVCPNKKMGQSEGYCPECGAKMEKLSLSDVNKLQKTKKRIDKGSPKVLFNNTQTDEEIINTIYGDMVNLSQHEAGTKWMRFGTLLSFNSTQQMIGAGFKAIIDQNKILIRQNELLLRELKRINR